MNKKRWIFQESDDSTVVEGGAREADSLPAPSVRPLWMLSAPDMAPVAVRLIAIRNFTFDAETHDI